MPYELFVGDNQGVISHSQGPETLAGFQQPRNPLPLDPFHHGEKPEGVKQVEDLFGAVLDLNVSVSGHSEEYLFSAWTLRQRVNHRAIFAPLANLGDRAG